MFMNKEAPFILQDLDDYQEAQFDHSVRGVVTLGKVPVRDNILLVGASLRDKELTTLDVSVEVPGKAIYIARSNQPLQVANITVSEPHGVLMLHDPVDELWLTKNPNAGKWQAHLDQENIASDKALKEFIGVVARFAFNKMPVL